VVPPEIWSEFDDADMDYAAISLNVMDGIWPVGLPRSLDYPAVPVGAILVGSARRFGTRTAFRHETDELSFAELWRQACRCANALAGQGIGCGSPVAVRMPNCLAYPVAYYGVLLAGATVVPISPLLPEREAANQIRDAGAAITLATVDIPALCANASDTPPELTLEVTHDLAHLAYTGGTTGASKGVRLTHHNVVVNIIQHGCWHHGCLPALDAEDGVVLEQVGSPDEWPVRLGSGIFINLMPWYHAMGIIAGLNMRLIIHPALPSPSHPSPPAIHRVRPPLRPLFAVSRSSPFKGCRARSRPWSARSRSDAAA
jgi:long-chain acyl-CoA synthetase